MTVITNYDEIVKALDHYATAGTKLKFYYDYWSKAATTTATIKTLEQGPSYEIASGPRKGFQFWPEHVAGLITGSKTPRVDMREFYIAQPIYYPNRESDPYMNWYGAILTEKIGPYLKGQLLYVKNPEYPRTQCSLPGIERIRRSQYELT